MYCLICYLKASKKRVLAVNKCTVAFVYVCVYLPLLYICKYWFYI